MAVKRRRATSMKRSKTISRDKIFTQDYIKRAVMESKKSVTELKQGYELTQEALDHSYNAQIDSNLNIKFSI